MLKTISLLIVLASILLVACSAIAPIPTATPVPSATPLPTDTPAPTAIPASTVTATAIALTPTPTQGTVADLVPKGNPAKEWNGIPIMPGALAGDGDAGSYRFTIKSSMDEIQSYYQKQLQVAGWTSLALGSGENGTSLLIFTKDAKTLSVSIIPSDDVFLVMIVQ